jgi:hypothetical protein
MSNGLVVGDHESSCHVGEHGSVDDVGEAALERPDRVLAGAAAFGSAIEERYGVGGDRA